MKRIVRPKVGRKLAGVCLALANYFSADVTLIRIAFVLLILPGGLPGFLPYVLLWILIPEEE
jgi:phage shock protein PspC (stress-responsive transcriptional regulator)